jgi:hypothetical protein
VLGPAHSPYTTPEQTFSTPLPVGHQHNLSKVAKRSKRGCKRTRARRPCRKRCLHILKVGRVNEES